MPTLTFPRPEIALHAVLMYAFCAFAIGLLLTPWFVSFLRRNRLGKQLRVETVDGREASIFRKYHEKKFGTPTMGGLLIWGSIVLTVGISRALALFGIIENSLFQRGQVYLPLFALLSLGVLGAIDDYLNVIGTDESQWRVWSKRLTTLFLVSFLLLAGLSFWQYGGGLDSPEIPTNVHSLVSLLVYILTILTIGSGIVALDGFIKRNKPDAVVMQKRKGGLAVLPKITTLIVISAILAFWFYFKNGYDSVMIPYFGDLHLGWWYIPLAIFLIVGTANAVNVTDGLDGLAGGLLVIAFAAFGVIAFFDGYSVLAAFCAACAGAVAAFLWHNVPPALFYMGDTGSLALGGTLAVIALMMDRMLLLPLFGFIFLIEMLSVLIQLTSKKLRGGKKIFRAAPIHHHFEALEWGESKVTMRFWIVGAFVAFLGVIVSFYGF